MSEERLVDFSFIRWRGQEDEYKKAMADKIAKGLGVHSCTVCICVASCYDDKDTNQCLKKMADKIYNIIQG